MNCRRFQPRKIHTRNFSRYSQESFKSDLRNCSWENIFNGFSDINDSWNSFKYHLTTIIDKHAPMTEKMVRGRDCPWLTTEIKSKIKERDFFLRKVRKSEMTTDWLTYKKLRNTVTQDIRRSKANYNRSLFSENINSPTQFWNQIKKCYPTKEKKLVTSKVFDIDETTTSDKTSIANGFCKYFTNVGKTLQMTLTTLGNTVWENHDHKNLSKRINPKELQFSFEKVSASNMVKLLGQLKASKASGHDGIPTSMIKDGAEELAVPLTDLINSCLEQSVFPDTEKYAKIIPVYKSGKWFSMENYRPISIPPVLSKVFEKVVQKQLYEYLEKNSLLSPNQFAFRKHRSTQHPVTLLSDHIKGHMDKGELTGAVYIDLRKAFDTIDHGRLLSKLPCYGIRGRELIWLEIICFDECNLLFLTRQLPRGTLSSLGCHKDQCSVPFSSYYL